MYTVSDKFRIRVFVRDITHFREFLPGGLRSRSRSPMRSIFTSASNTTGTWSSRFPRARSRRFRLGRDAQVGWTSWMSPNWAKTDETYRSGRAVPRGQSSPKRDVAGNNDGRGHQHRSGRRQAQSRRLRIVPARVAAGQERRKPQPRARPLAHAYPAEGPHGSRADRRSFQARPRASCLADATAVVNGFRKNETEMPGISNPVADALDRGWHYATLLFGETQIRTGHLLVGILKSVELRRALIGVSQEFAKLPVDEIAAGQGAIWTGSDEGNLRPMDGSGVAAAGTESATATAPAPRAPPRSIGSARISPPSQGRTDGPRPRPRGRGAPGHRRSDAPAAEQSDPHRRSGRGQNRDRRRLRPAHRIGRRPAAASRASSSAFSTSASCRRAHR